QYCGAVHRDLDPDGDEGMPPEELAGWRQVPPKTFEEILELLESLDKHANLIRRQGGDFADYVDKRSAEGVFPMHLVKVREGNHEAVHYFTRNDELEQFKAEHPDLFGGNDTEERRRDGPTRRAKHADLHHESKSVAELLTKLSRKGLSVAHYAAQDHPLFELIEGEGEKAHVTPLFSIPEILRGVMAVG